MTRSRMGPGRDCGLDPTRLRGLLDETLGGDEERVLLDHLGECESCQRTLEGLAAEGAWWDNLRRFASCGTSEAPAPQGIGEEIDEVGLHPAAARDDLMLDFLAPADDPRYIGRLGRYEVTGVIGRGGMGLVLKAFDPPLNRFVAVKVLAPGLASGAAARNRFAREARAAAAVTHEHVVPIYAVDITAGLPYLVMPYITGHSLRERLERDGPLSLEEILRIGMQTAAGLAAAHAQGLVHRDVKPANILLENGVERVKLSDFGLARAVDDASITQSGVVTGTPEYMSPEQARGDAVDHRADLFSLGGVLYAMATGHSPFRARTSLGVLRRVCDERHRPVRQLNPTIPAWLEEIVDRLLEKDPAARFPTAAELADLLGRHLARVQNPALPPVEHPWTSLQARARRSRRRAAGLVLAAAVVFGAALAGRFVPGSPQSEAPSATPATPGPADPPVPDSGRLRTEYYQDFRKAQFDTKALKVAKWNTERLLRAEPAGLRVTIPASREKRYQVGIAPRFNVRGDFEITTSYEILKADPARDGWGMGANLSIEVDSAEKEGLSIENNEVPPRPGQEARAGRVFNSTFVTGPPQSRNYNPRSVPTRAKRGKLRITRAGSTAVAWYADGGATFRPLREVELGVGDLGGVLLSANAGGSGHGLDIVFHDLRIRAEELPGWSGSPPPAGRSPWGIVAAGTGLFVLAGAATWWIAASRRRAAVPALRSRAEATEEVAVAGKPALLAGWDEEGLQLLEARARAFAETHPDAGAFVERPRFQFGLRNGVLHGPFVAWHEVDPETLRGLGTKWADARNRLPKRFEGEYRDGARHGLFACHDQAGDVIERGYRAGERVG